MKIHIVGIGGIGVSALAQYYLATGHNVSGSDLARSEITDMLRKKGAKIFIGKHKARNVAKDIQLVIYSPAVPANNPELKEAKKRFPSSSLPRPIRRSFSPLRLVEDEASEASRQAGAGKQVSSYEFPASNVSRSDAGGPALRARNARGLEIILFSR